MQELAGLGYRCLEDCGFCCTFTPEVAHDELAALRRQFPQLPVTQGMGGLRIAFQGGCGACTLLARRKCQAYEDRPAHCRYFPFHVYFGRRTEVYVNRSCRGVEPLPGGDLKPAYMEQVAAVAKPHAMLEHERLARRVHRDFERNAREAGMWQDTAPSLEALLARPDRLPVPTQEDLLEPFGGPDVVSRPFYLAPDLRWLTFERRGRALQPLEMQEDGSLSLAGTPFEPAMAPLSPEVVAELRRLATRDCLAGQAFFLVDESAYVLSVERALAQRLGTIAGDLRLAASILENLRVPAAGELARFYDSRFLDAPTIGGWL